jgi:hypothetical protein
MSSASAAVTTYAAGDMTFSGHTVADFKPSYFAPALYDFTAKLVADSERYLNRIAGPVIPLVYVNISSAYGGTANFNQYIIVTNLGDRNILHPQTAFSF